MRELLAEIYRRNRVLAVAGWLHLALLLVMFFISLFDARTVLGLNTWTKASKFAVSITLYLWTLAWLIKYLRIPRWLFQIISWGPALVMIGESVCLVIQAARGTRTHFNLTTPFDASVFGMMGFLIFLNSILALLITILFFTRAEKLPPAYIWAIRLGLLFFLFAAYEGTVMISNGAHTIGLADGGPGLPMVNWSTKAGDLRIAHLLGLHALQVLPVAGYLISSWKEKLSQSRQIAYIFAFALIYTGVTALLFWQAMKGRPIIALGAILI
ncbi:MAG: hypothetical protein WBP93_21360 [Pyrinomonadaceae bacterium]